jgi:DNA-binding beta-propeller fold protein YncE
MEFLATIPLTPDPRLSIPFRLHVSADGSRIAILNTYGMPYAQALIVADTRTHEVVGKWDFPATGEHPFHLDVQLTPDGAAAVLVGGVLLDAQGEDFAAECRLTRIDLATGEQASMAAGEVGFSYLSVAPDGKTAYVFHNGSDRPEPPAFRIHVVDLPNMRLVKTIETEAPVNNVLYRPREGRALVSLGRDVVSFDLGAHEIGEKVCPRFNHPYLLAAFSPEDPLIYAAFVASHTVIKIIDVNKREVVGQHAYGWDWTASTNIVPFGDTHLVFPPGSSAGAVFLWNRHTRKIEHQVSLPDYLVLAVPHPDGKHFYLFDHTDRSLKVVAAAPLLRPYEGPEEVPMPGRAQLR